MMKTTKTRKAIKIAVVALLILFAVFSAVSMIFIHISYHDMFGRAEANEFTAYLRYSDVSDEYPRELLSFYVSGKTRLQGYLYGEGNTKGIVVISHGMGGGAEGYIAETMYFVDHGYTVFGFDNTGCYLSEGDGMGGMPQSAIDLDAALDFIESEPRFEGLPIFLYGHSWGGYAVTEVLSRGHDITASASVSGYNTPNRIVFEWARDMMGMGALAYIEAPYLALYNTICYGADANRSAVCGINATNTPVLIIHGINDTTVSYESASIISHRDEITNPNVEYMICEEENHDDHNWLFMSDAAVTYVDGLNALYNELKEQYSGEIPKDAEAGFYENVDKWLASELDEEFMHSVIDFFERAANK